MNAYGTYSEELYEAFMEYNDKAGDNISQVKSYLFHHELSSMK